MQSKECNCLLDWQGCNFAPPAVEFLHFYDLLPFHVEGFKISLKERPFSLAETKKIYLEELRKNDVKINTKNFNKSLKSAVYFQIAHNWAPLLKPDVIYLHGGRYFVHRTLRLLPSRKVMREHFKKLLEIGKK